jgi:kinesin family protein 3/17
MSVLEGYNGTVFAYGQTGTGKTWTMEGDRKSNTNKGIICRSFEHIFKAIRGSPDRQFLVAVSMLEIYNEEVRDLLKGDGQKLKLKQDETATVYVDGLSSEEVKSEADCMKLLDKGSGNKEVASTDMNARSSRSHSIFTITVE